MHVAYTWYFFPKWLVWDHSSECSWLNMLGTGQTKACSITNSGGTESKVVRTALLYICRPCLHIHLQLKGASCLLLLMMLMTQWILVDFFLFLNIVRNFYSPGSVYWLFQAEIILSLCCVFEKEYNKICHNPVSAEPKNCAITQLPLVLKMKRAAFVIDNTDTSTRRQLLLILVHSVADLKFKNTLQFH